LSLYGIFRLVLNVLAKASMFCTFIVFSIAILTILLASLSTIRAIDIKEFIAYSSVSHAAVYLLGAFSNVIQGIQGSIILGLAHGFVSPGLFICGGGVLYDRVYTRLITFFKGMAQIMPLFAILFFILSLGNCGAPLTLNFIGEFLSLYGAFEKLPFLGVFGSSSIIFSAAYTIFMFNRVSFGGVLSRFFTANIPDLNKREFNLLLVLVVLTVVLGVYVAPILDVLNYSTSLLVYSVDINSIYCDSSVD
jgi:NADH-ubiquinone oxidoreductase chain 4